MRKVDKVIMSKNRLEALVFFTDNSKPEHKKAETKEKLLFKLGYYVGALNEGKAA